MAIFIPQGSGTGSLWVGAKGPKVGICYEPADDVSQR